MGKTLGKKDGSTRLLDTTLDHSKNWLRYPGLQLGSNETSGGRAYDMGLGPSSENRD